MVRSRLFILSDQLRTTFWFLPLIITALLGLFSLVVIQLDRLAFETLNLQISADSVILENSTTLLIAIAGAIATIAGTIFSLMLVVLTLASQQYGPIIVVNFIRDRRAQAVFGVYLGTFIFSLTTLVASTYLSREHYAPLIAVNLASGLAILCTLLMIYFIHHIAVSIRPTSIIGTITKLLNENIRQLFPERISGQPSMQPLAEDERLHLQQIQSAGRPVLSTQSGYVNFIALDAVITLARERDVTLALHIKPGSFVVRRAVIASVYPAERWTADDQKALNRLLYVSPHRTPAHDVDLLYTQIVAIAVKALSPAVNDPFTAMMCIDHLGEAFAKMSERCDQNPYVFDEDNALRVVLMVRAHEFYLHLIFDQIWHYGVADIKVALHVLETISTIGEVLHDPEKQTTIQRYAGQLWGAARKVHTAEMDRIALENAYRRLSIRLSD